MKHTDFDTFYELHQTAQPLLIANAWNAKSASIIEKSGYRAVATSSGAIADSLGYRAGEQISFKEVLYIVERIKSNIKIPLTVDIERGYAADVQTLTGNIQKLIDLGVAGINIEDAEGEETYLAKLSGIKSYLQKTGQKLFINARIDAFQLKLPSPLETTLKRMKLYEDAGADCLFIAGLQEPTVIAQICKATTLPVNIVSPPKVSSIDTLIECGVRRISMAGWLFKETYNQMNDIVNMNIKISGK